jgi:hypothetical protein
LSVISGQFFVPGEWAEPAPGYFYPFAASLIMWLEKQRRK